MYYYIFDVKKIKKSSQVEAIKNYLNGLGISGEFTCPTAAQSTEELVDLGISKQYSTIVAIGGNEIANQVASKLVGRKEAMGFVPCDASEEIEALVGTNSWKEACEILRFRKISEIHLGKTSTGNSFLTNAQLDIRLPVDVTLEFKDFIIQAKVKDLMISNFHPSIKKIANDYLDIVFTSVDNNQGLLSKFSSIFGKEKENNDRETSLVRARSLRIFTKSQISILAGDSVVAKTPQYIESTDEKLRLITAKKAAEVWEK